MVLKNKFTIFLLICIVFIGIVSNSSIAYKMETDQVPKTPTHQMITKEAEMVWNLIPIEISNHLIKSILDENLNGKYDSNRKDDIITGSAEEDMDIWRSKLNGNRHHFWDPDSPTGFIHLNDYSIDEYYYLLYYYDRALGDSELFDSKSSFNQASIYWLTKAIPYYLKGDIDKAYYWLGRIAHLLEDASASPHILLDQHLFDYAGKQLGDLISNSDYEYYDDSILEEYTGKYYDDFTAENLDLIGKEYIFENLIDEWSNEEWIDVNPNIEKANYPSELFKLFWYTAQKTQYYASDDVDGNSYYKKPNDDTKYYFSNEGINLWENDDVTMVSDKSAFFNGDLDDTSNEDFLYSSYDLDDNCLLIENSVCTLAVGNQICWYCNPNERRVIGGGNIEKEAEALMGHAMKAVAGLYRLFWIKTHSYDWPMYQQNLQRTGMTILKGNIKDNSLRQNSISIDPEFSGEYSDKPSIGNIDDDGNLEIVMTSSRYGLASQSKGKIYAVECETENDCNHKWTSEITTDEPIWGNPIIARLQNNNNRQEIIIASDNKIYVLNGNNGKKIGKYFPIEPKEYDPNAEKIAGFVTHTAVADIDYDGEKEIIFTDYLGIDTWESNLFVLDENNKRKYKILLGQEDLSGGADGAVAIANIIQESGTDYPEIVVGNTFGLYIYRYNGNNNIEEVNHYLAGGIYSTPVIADINMDNKYEIIFATATHKSICFNNSYVNCSNTLWVLDNEGNYLDSYNFTGEFPRSDISVGRIDSDDSDMEIVIATRDNFDYYNASGPISSEGSIKVFKLDSNDNIVQATPHEFDDNGNLDTSKYPVAIADIDGNGIMNLIFGENGEYLHIIERDGSSFTKTISSRQVGKIVTTPTVGDWDNDGSAEIIVRNLKLGTQSLQEFSSQYNKIENKMKENHGGFANEFLLEEILLQSGDTELTLISQNNTKPVLTVQDVIIAKEGELIQINATGTDSDDDELEFYYSSPFDENGTWQSIINDSGEYEVLVTVSDGNLTDLKYINLILLRNDSTKLNVTNQHFESNTSINNSFIFNMSNETRIWLANLKISSKKYETMQSNFIKIKGGYL